MTLYLRHPNIERQAKPLSWCLTGFVDAKEEHAHIYIYIYIYIYIELRKSNSQLTINYDFSNHTN
jgi:hypothetical protein